VNGVSAKSALLTETLNVHSFNVLPYSRGLKHPKMTTVERLGVATTLKHNVSRQQRHFHCEIWTLSQSRGSVNRGIELERDKAHIVDKGQDLRNGPDLMAIPLFHV
jgi:hypothetical protein